MIKRRSGPTNFATSGSLSAKSASSVRNSVMLKTTEMDSFLCSAFSSMLLSPSDWISSKPAGTLQHLRER